MNEKTLFSELVKFNPTLALVIGRMLLVLIYVVVAPLDALYQGTKEVFKSLKRVGKAFIKPFRNFAMEWKSVKTQIEYWEDNSL